MRLALAILLMVAGTAQAGVVRTWIDSDRKQADGHRKIVECHEDDTGRVHTYRWMAEEGQDAEARAKGRVLEIEAQMEEEKRAVWLDKLESGECWAEDMDEATKTALEDRVNEKVVEYSAQIARMKMAQYNLQTLLARIALEKMAEETKEMAP
jgi:hypothetical protein